MLRRESVSLHSWPYRYDMEVAAATPAADAPSRSCWVPPLEVGHGGGAKRVGREHYYRGPGHQGPRFPPLAMSRLESTWVQIFLGRRFWQEMTSECVTRGAGRRIEAKKRFDCTGKRGTPPTETGDTTRDNSRPAPPAPFARGVDGVFASLILAEHRDYASPPPSETAAQRGGEVEGRGSTPAKGRRRNKGRLPSRAVGSFCSRARLRHGRCFSPA